MGLITHPHTSHNQSNWGITRMVLTSCFQEFNILSKKSFSVVLAAVFVYTCDILKTSSFLFVHMWFEGKKKKKPLLLCVFFQSVDDLKEVLE